MILDSKARRVLADGVRAHADAVAEEVTDEFLRVHPDWLHRYGARARVMGIEDARYHITFLAAAVESGAPTAFSEYARWTARVLASRNIAPVFLAENLTQIRRALATRLATGAPIVDAYVAEALHALDRNAGADDERNPGTPLALTRGMYLQAVLAGSRMAALNVAREALREGLSIIDLYVDVLQATLFEIGRLWETNRITVAHEHAATAITQFVMAQMYDRLERIEGGTRTILLTGLEGELHSVGALMVADVLETRGWTVHFIGTNLPHASILDAIRERQPNCVGISATMLFNLPAVRRLIEGVRSEWGSTKRIVVGGGAFRHAPDLWREIGADGYGRHLRDALELI
jgi:MerR family transcriptional regulator, light-induced transcriptional regulator